MNENDRTGSGNAPRQSFAAAPPPTASKTGVERSGAASTLSGASASVRSEAKELGSQAQRLAGEQAEKAKEAAASHLDVFADALRAASDELTRNQGGPAAEMVSNAASGLEGLTRSLHGKSTGQMIETVRRFGRESPVAFLAGSVLAGLALGRFAAVAATDEPAATPHTGSTPPAAQQAAGSPRPTTQEDFR